MEDGIENLGGGLFKINASPKLIEEIRRLAAESMKYNPECEQCGKKFIPHVSKKGEVTKICWKCEEKESR